MTEHVSTETINVKINALLEARREDLEARKEDRERRDAERQEDRSMLKELSVHMGEMAVAVTEQAKNNEHLNQRMDKVEKKQDAQDAELKTIKNVQSGNKVRWQVLIAGIASFIAVGGLFLTAFLWVADKIIT